MNLNLTLYYDVTDLEDESHDVASFSCTHYLARMASEAGVYNELWRPVETFGEFARASDLILGLQDGVERLEADPDEFSKFDCPSGRGTYQVFVDFVVEVLEACERHPRARVRTWT